MGVLKSKKLTVFLIILLSALTGVMFLQLNKKEDYSKLVSQVTMEYAKMYAGTELSLSSALMSESCIVKIKEDEVQLKKLKASNVKLSDFAGSLNTSDEDVDSESDSGFSGSESGKYDVEGDSDPTVFSKDGEAYISSDALVFDKENKAYVLYSGVYLEIQRDYVQESYEKLITNPVYLFTVGSVISQSDLIYEVNLKSVYSGNIYKFDVTVTDGKVSTIIPKGLASE